MTTNFDYDALKQAIKKKALEMAEQKVNALAANLQSYIGHEFKVDLAQSENRNMMEAFDTLKVGVEKKNETAYDISISMDGLSEEEKETLSFYFDNAKKRLGM